MKVFKNKINDQYEIVEKILLDKQFDLIERVDMLEDQMDELRSRLVKDHIARLEKGECSLSSSSIFINLVSNLERTGDHLHTMAHSIVNNN